MSPQERGCARKRLPARSATTAVAQILGHVPGLVQDVVVLAPRPVPQPAEPPVRRGTMAGAAPAVPPTAAGQRHAARPGARPERPSVCPSIRLKSAAILPAAVRAERRGLPPVLFEEFPHQLPVSASSGFVIGKRPATCCACCWRGGRHATRSGYWWAVPQMGPAPTVTERFICGYTRSLAYFNTR